MLDKRRFAGLLRRAPWLSAAAQRIMRPFMPWVTVGAIGAVFNDAGDLLLVEHVFHPKYPWGLPGGWMARGENPDETVRREVLEETSLHVNVIKPLIVAHTPFLPRHLDVAYLCHAPDVEGKVRLSSELLAYRWVSRADLGEVMPMLRFHERTIQAALHEWVYWRGATPDPEKL